MDQHMEELREDTRGSRSQVHGLSLESPASPAKIALAVYDPHLLPEKEGDLETESGGSNNGCLARRPHY